MEIITGLCRWWLVRRGWVVLRRGAGGRFTAPVPGVPMRGFDFHLHPYRLVHGQWQVQECGSWTWCEADKVPEHVRLAMRAAFAAWGAE